MDKNIKKIYNNPKLGLVSANELHRKLNDKGYDYTLDQVKDSMQNDEGYTINKNVVRSFPMRRTYANYVDELWQADLVEMDVPQGAPAKENDGIRYLLTVIDVFSKYAFVSPLKNKTGKAVATALQDIFKIRHPEKLQTDEGNEFYNKDCTSLFNKYKINHYSSRSDYKAAVVERFNRTLKLKMGRLFEVTQKFRYIDALPDLVENYNNTYHTAVKMTPIEASDKKKTDIVYNNLYSDVPPARPPRLNVGDFVRIPAYKSIFTKEIIGKWSVEFFKVKEVKQTNPVTYEIEDIKDEPVVGSYYEEELQKISKDAIHQAFRIKEVIETKKVGKKTEAFVSFVGWPEKFNEWIEYDKLKHK